MLALFLLQSPAAANPLLQFVPILAIFAIFYFLLFLPMQRQRKAQQKMLSELKNGDVVVTTGGIIGTIVEIKTDESLVIRVKPDSVRLQLSRGAVQSVVPPEQVKS